MKLDGYKLLCEMLEEELMDEDYSDKEKQQIKKAFGKAKGKPQVQRKKIIKKVFGKVEG